MALTVQPRVMGLAEEEEFEPQQAPDAKVVPNNLQLDPVRSSVPMIQIKKPRSDPDEYMAQLRRQYIQSMKNMRGMVGDTLTGLLYPKDLVEGTPRTIKLPEEFQYSWKNAEGRWTDEYEEELSTARVQQLERYMEHGTLDAPWEPEAQPGAAGMTQSWESLLGPTLGRSDIWLPTLMSGSSYEKHEVINGLIKDLAIIGAVEAGPVAAATWNLAFKGAALTLKNAVKAGVWTPRQVVRLVDHTIRKIPGQKGVAHTMEGVWENWIVKPAHMKVFPGYSEGPKSLADIFQPALERIPERLQTRIRNTNAKRTLLNELSIESGFDLAKMKPGERHKFISDMGKGNLPHEMGQKLKAINLPKTHHAYFRSALQKRFSALHKHMEETLPKTQDLSDFMDSPATMEFLQGIDSQLTGTFKPKVAEMYLKKAINNDLVDPKLRLWSRDLLNLTYDTPKAMAEAAKDAGRKYLVDQVKLTGMAKMVKPVAEESWDWMLWKGTQFSGLKDLYLPRDVWLEMKAIEQISKIGHRAFGRWFMTPWKTAKVVMRPATHVRNVISNVILNDWGGLPFYRMDVYWDAMKEMQRGGKHWKQWKKLTGGGGTFTLEDIGELTKGQRYPSNAVDWAFGVFDRVAAPMRKMYNAEEQVAKLAKFMYNQKELGMGTREAMTDAMKWTFNYGEVTRATAMMRSYAAPFFTWQSKVLPLFAETMAKRPWKMAKWYLFYEGLQRQAIESTGLTGDEWANIDRILPEYIQDGQFLLMPWRDSQKRLQILNLTYMIPGFGDISELMSHPSDTLFGHPLMSVAGALRTNRTFSGAPICYDWEEPSIRFMKKAKYLWQSLAPLPSFPLVPGSFDWDMMWRHYENHPEAPTWGQIAAAQVGFKLKPIDPVTRRKTFQAVKGIKQAQIGSQMRRELRRTRDPEKRRQIARRFNRLRFELSREGLPE